MKRAIAGLVTFGTLVSGQTLPAFPGAEGFGSRTPGGRGGRVIVVRNLNDSGPGSLRDACEAKGPRIVVFAVAGIIDLKSTLKVTEPFITIAGQSAPGDGICLRGHGLYVGTHDVIVRFLRSRPGDIAGGEVDAIGIGGEARDVILDHCSATWSVDEALSPSGAVSNITVQWCLIGESLNRSVHSKGPHGYGSLVRAVGGVSLHHNLWIDNTARNPRLGDNYGKPPYPIFDFRNNVIYNWGGTCSGMTGDRLSANYVNNYLRPGPSSDRKKAPIVLTTTADVRYYVDGNVVEGLPQFTREKAAMFTPAQAGGRALFTLVDRPFEVPPVRTTSAQTAFEEVLQHVGAVCPGRDPVDARLIEQVRRGSGAIINSQNDVGAWPEYRPGPLRDTSALRDIEAYLNGLARECQER